MWLWPAGFIIEVILREIFALRQDGVLGGETFAAARWITAIQVITINPDLDLGQDVLDEAARVIQGIIDQTISIP